MPPFSSPPYNNAGSGFATPPPQQQQPQHHQQQLMPPAPASGVQVLVRVRPPLPRELMYDSGVEVRPPYDIKIYSEAQEFSGRYHHVFGEDASQAAVYERVRDCVPLALAGYNSTIFAYGQTGTGKTYTMMGDDASGGDGPLHSPGRGGGGGAGAGIIPRAIKELFREAKAKQDAEGAAIQVVVSYMEIYNDRLHDLLQPYKPYSTRDPADMNQKRALLEVREDARGNTYVPNLLCVKVKSYKSVYQLIAKGNRNRAVRHTEMNQASSRSHAILQLVLEQWPRGGADGTCIRSKLNFVDLAGSERWSTAAAAASAWEAAGGGAAAAAEALLGDERISEMTSINGSLSALGSVVAALTERRPHVPYRDSRLTHLLQDSLGGNCRTTLLATLSPSQDAFEESCSTLRFADRARAIANNPVVNASRDMGSILALKEREIQRLRAMLAQMAAPGTATAAGANGLATADGADGVAARLAEELEATRRALEMERALRAELQQRLHTHVGAAGGAGAGSGGGGADGAAADGVLGDLVPATGSGGGGANILTLGTPATAFDAAGSPAPQPRRSSSLRGSGSAGTADFFRLSTPSTPLNSVPEHLAALGADGGGGGRLCSPSVALSQSGLRNLPGGAPPNRARSSAAVNGTGRLGGGGGAAAAPGSAGGLASPAAGGAGRGGLQRRLSFDEAIMSIKSQVINLSAQERSRLRARQAPPPPRGFWGGGQAPATSPPQPALPPAAPPGLSAPLPPPPPGHSKSSKVAGLMGIYGGGAAVAAAPQRRQPPPPAPQLSRHAIPTIGSGVLVNGGVGGAFGSLTVIQSIEMTESSFDGEPVSPKAHALVQHSQSHQVRSPGSGGGAGGGAAAMAAAVGKSHSYPNGFGHGHGHGHGQASGHSGRGSLVAESSVVEEEEDVRRDEAEEAEGSRFGEEDLEEGRDGGGEGEEVTEEEDEELVEEEEQGGDGGGTDPRRHGNARGRGRGGGGRERAGSGSGGGGGSASGDVDDDVSDAGLSQLDPEEYEEIMREAREALARQQAASGAAPGAGPPAAGGRAALQQQSLVGASSGGGGGGGGGGWGRNALLTKSSGQTEVSQGDPDVASGAGGGGGGGGFGRSAFAQAVTAETAPSASAVPAPATAPPGGGGGGSGGGGWGRRSILAGAAAAAASPPPQQPQLPQPPASADAAVAAARAAPGGRRALIAELMSDDVSHGRGSVGGGAAGLYGMYGGMRNNSSPSPRHMRSTTGGGGWAAGRRSQSVGLAGRPNGGSRGGAADRVAKLDAGSWIYILGASASSTRAKQLASALQLDPRTGLPAL